MQIQLNSFLYARAGVAGYRIVNSNERVLEVRREPLEMSALPLGFGTAQTWILRAGEVVSTLMRPDFAVRVEDLLP